MLLRRKLLLSGVVLFVLLCFSSVPSAGASLTWSQTYGGTEWDWAGSVIATSDGGYAVAGAWNGMQYEEVIGYLGGFNADFWLVKTDEFGVVPEYSSRVIPVLVVTAALFILINKKKLLHTRSQVS
jgi:hypothetical protein